MAGMGPPPNPNARRRNDRSAGFRTLPERCSRPAPPCPLRSKRARGVWESWWSSPMAEEWHEADVEWLGLALRMLLSDDVQAAKEARQWADRFGMSPLARLRNRWLLPESGEAEASAERADATVIRLRPSG